MTRAWQGGTVISRDICLKLRHIIFYTHGGKNNSRFFMVSVVHGRLCEEPGGPLAVLAAMYEQADGSPAVGGSVDDLDGDFKDRKRSWNDQGMARRK